MASDGKQPTGAQQSATGRNNPNLVAASRVLTHYQTKQLSQAHHTAIEMLLRGESDAVVGEKLGVDRGTVYRWRTAHPAFSRELERMRRIIWKQQAERLRAMVSPALDVLQQHLADPRTSLRAAAIIMRQTAPRAAELPNPERERRDAQRDFNRALDAYINAPMPDGTVGPRVSIGDDDEEEDDDLDESDD